VKYIETCLRQGVGCDRERSSNPFSPRKERGRTWQRTRARILPDNQCGESPRNLWKLKKVKRPRQTRSHVSWKNSPDQIRINQDVPAGTGRKKEREINTESTSWGKNSKWGSTSHLNSAMPRAGEGLRPEEILVDSNLLSSSLQAMTLAGVGVKGGGGFNYRLFHLSIRSVRTVKRKRRRQSPLLPM